MEARPYIPEYASLKPPAGDLRLRGMLLVLGIEFSIIFVGAVIFACLEQGIVLSLWTLGLGLFIMGLQFILLLPVPAPRADRTKRKSWKVVLSASVLGMLAGMLICGIVGLIGDCLWGLGAIPTEGKSMAEGPAIGIAWIGLGVFLVSWVVMTPLLFLFMVRSPAEQRLFQVASSLFVGTIVEALSAVGMMAMVSRKSDCICATFSFAALFLSFCVGAVVFGPGVLLLILWRRARFTTDKICPVCGKYMGEAGYYDKCPHCGAGWKQAAPGSSV